LVVVAGSEEVVDSEEVVVGLGVEEDLAAGD
jgi:hypothetical protein